MERSSFTRSRWLPWSSIEFPFTVPPQASFPFKNFERSSRSISVGSRPSITVTSFPYRRLLTLTLILCCSFATSSQIQSSLGSPHVGQMPPIITAIFKFWLFITWHCRESITLFLGGFPHASVLCAAIQMNEYAAHGRRDFVACGKERNGGCDLPVPGAPGDTRGAVQIPEHEPELVRYRRWRRNRNSSGDAGLGFTAFSCDR